MGENLHPKLSLFEGYIFTNCGKVRAECRKVIEAQIPKKQYNNMEKLSESSLQIRVAKDFICNLPLDVIATYKYEIFDVLKESIRILRSIRDYKTNELNKTLNTCELIFYDERVMVHINEEGIYFTIFRGGQSGRN